MLDPILLRIAKNAILGRFDSKYTINKKELLSKHPFLSDDGATFVTLNYDGALRGCIGSIIAHRTLLEDIIYNALSAAFGDPRFEPLKIQELSHLKLEISLLSKPEILEYENYNELLNRIKPNKDGLILKYGPYQGTFLPQVWEQLPTPQAF